MRHGSSAAVATSILVLLLTGCAAPTEQISDDLHHEDTVKYLEENAQALARDLGIEDPPKVDTIRLIALPEWATTQISCLFEEGYEATLTEDGEGVRYPQFSEPSMTDAFHLALYRCELRYPVAPRFMAPLRDDQLGRLFDYRAGALVECLEQQGLSGFAAAPSREVFIESRGQWSPYSGLALTDEQIRELPQVCPEVPEDFYE